MPQLINLDEPPGGPPQYGPNSWLSTPQLSALLGVPIQTLHRWASQGYGPAYSKVGRGRRYLYANVMAFMKLHETDFGITVESLDPKNAAGAALVQRLQGLRPAPRRSLAR